MGKFWLYDTAKALVLPLRLPPEVCIPSMTFLIRELVPRVGNEPWHPTAEREQPTGHQAEPQRHIVDKTPHSYHMKPRIPHMGTIRSRNANRIEIG